MASLLAQFEQDRTQVGVIGLIDGNGATVMSYSALGKAANDTAAANGNPGALPLYPYGDTPTGMYTVGAVVCSGAGTKYPSHSYGDVGVIPIVPLSGDALTAKNNGRTGLLIHGGDPGNGQLLRRTCGCIRMMNSELADMISKMTDLQIQGDPVQNLTVQESPSGGKGPCDDNTTCEESDPPQ